MFHSAKMFRPETRTSITTNVRTTSANSSEEVWTVNRKHLQPKSCLADLKNLAKEYCQSATIQGVRYLVLDYKYPIERLFWVVALLLCLIGSSVMINKIKEKLDTSPVIVTFAENSANIWDVPFPAVTICPQTKSRQTAFNFTKNFLKFKHYKTNGFDTSKENSTLSSDILEKVRALGVVCTVLYEATQLEWSTYISDEALKFLEEVAGILKDFDDDYYCSWSCPNISCCDEIFKKVWSEEGICYTFNNIEDQFLYRDHVVNNQIFGHKNLAVRNDWDPDKGYDQAVGRSTYPWRATGSGNIWSQGLNLYLSEMETDIDYICKTSLTGYQTILHNPMEMPLAKSNVVVDAPFEKKVAIFVKPALIFTSLELQNYEPHKRQCYFSHEKYLHNFKYYTKKNCEIECLVNATLKRCGCLPFYLPRNRSTKICGARKRYCELEAANELHLEMIDLDLKQRAGGESLTSSISQCDCLPSCMSVEYSADVTVANYETSKFFTSANITHNKETVKRLFSNIEITVKHSEFMPIRRRELYGTIDFLANCGGILGLFSGFSIISAIEILYFLTLRLWSTLAGRWSGRLCAKCNSKQ